MANGNANNQRNFSLQGCNKTRNKSRTYALLMGLTNGMAASVDSLPRLHSSTSSCRDFSCEGHN